MIGAKYFRIPLTYEDSHLSIPFSSSIKRNELNKSIYSNGTGNHSTNYPEPDTDTDGDMETDEQGTDPPTSE